MVKYSSYERSSSGARSGSGAFDITPHPSEEHDYSSLVALPNVHPALPGYRGRGRPPLHLKRQHWSARASAARAPPAQKLKQQKRELVGAPGVAVAVAPGTIVGTLPSPSTAADGTPATGANAADAKTPDEAAARATAPLSAMLPLLGLMRKKRGRKPKDPSRLAARLLHDALIGISSASVFI